MTTRMESRGVMQASEQDGDRKVMFEKAKSQRSGDDAHHEEDKGGCQKYDADRTQELKMPETKCLYMAPTIRNLLFASSQLATR